jgi:hypothetical protein
MDKEEIQEGKDKCENQNPSSGLMKFALQDEKPHKDHPRNKTQ